VLQAAWDPAIDVDRYAATCAAVLDAYLAPAPSSGPASAVARAQR